MTFSALTEVVRITSPRPASRRSAAGRVLSIGDRLRRLLPVLAITGLLGACGGSEDASNPVASATVRATAHSTVTAGSAGVQFVRLRALSEINGNPWASMAEFNLVDTSGAVLPRAGWSVVADSQETVGENAAASNAIDGDPNTFWHTQWYAASPPMPHTFTVNLGATAQIGGFKYLPRQVGVNGRIANYQFFTSTDGNTWTQVAQGTFPNTASESTVLLSQGPTLSSLSNRTDPVNTAVTQPVSATDPGYALSYLALGLPPGLAIDAASGLISGTPTTVGTYAVTVQVTDSHSTTSGAFTWTIASVAGTGITARYVRLQALSEVNGNPWTSVAEFNLLDSGGSLIPRSGWTVTADSQELVGENGAATNTLDSDPNTYWHTQWYTANPVPPHALTVNLGALLGIGGFKYLPRQVGVNGRIANYQFYTSLDGITWSLITSGVFPNSANEATVLLVAPANHPPVLSAVANRSDVAGQSVTQAVLATDADNDTLTYSATGLPNGLAIDSAKGTIAGTPTASGTFAVTVTVGDGKNTASTSFTWVITTVNHAPVLTPLAGRTDVAGQFVMQAVSATDADGDTLTYSATGLPPGVSINAGTGTISGTPTTVATVTVNVTVSDGRATAASSFTWVITAANHAPVLSPLSGRTDVTGHPVSQTVSASDADGDTLTYSATGLPTGVAINTASGTMSGTPTASGTFTVTVNVSDGRASAMTSFTWLVTANHPPVLTPLAARTDVTGQFVTQAVSASDADGDTLSFSATGLPTGLAINAATGTMSGAPTATGSFMVTVAVADGRGASVSTAFTWTITAANHPPTITALAGRTDVAGQPVAQTVAANDLDGDTLSYSATGLPTGLGINATNGTMSGTPTASGSFTVTVAVSDGKASTSTSFTWVITAANHPPVLSPVSNRTDVAGLLVSQPVVATDQDGDILTYSAISLPPGLAIGATSGTISGTPTTAGTYSAMVTVSDGRASASTLFTWVITSPASASGGVTASYVRLIALSEINGNPWTSMAEFNLVDPNGVTLSRSGWTVTADSQELVGENGAATNAIDGDPTTFWHTQWYSASPPPPHTFTVGLGGPRLIGGFKYLPRQVGVNGRIANYQFYTSSDGISWQLLTQGTFAGDASEKTVAIAAPAAVNHPPVLTSLPATRTDAVGSAITLAVVARDPDGDPLTYAATGLPTGLLINAASGIISGTATQANTFYPTVSVSDGRGGSASQSFTWVIAAAPTVTPPSSAPGASGTSPPVVFNASTSAVAGDVISLQGENFGTAPSVYFDGYPATPLTIVDSVGTGWLAVQIPTTATAALVLRISNGTGISAQIKLNAARAYHLDTTELHPGGAFRLFGRNLKTAGGVTSVTVNGLAASIDVTNSTEHMLLLTMPAASQAASTTTILVDNGNGSGPAQLDRTATIATAGTGDPFALGVGWGADFSTIAGQPIYPATDSRIGDKAMCNGSHDDGGAIQQAIDLASANGGGVVMLPAGRCSFSPILTLRSNVVVRGAGKTSTELYHTAANYPAIGQGIDLAGMSDLTLTNSQNGDSMLLKISTRVFLKNVKINIGTSNQMYLDGNVNFVFAGSDVVQNGNANQQGPYTLDNDRGLVFESNTTTWVSGAPTFGKIHDASIRSSHFTRNATNQNTPGAVHSLTLDFAYRVSVIGNLFDVIGGPITNTTRNDGETILTEGGGANRTENNGKVGSATATTMTDTTNTLNVDPFGYGYTPEDLGISIVSGKGAGQMRHIVAYSASTYTATVDHAWDSIPDSTSRYATSVFGLEQGLIEANTLSQNPRGIWLYTTSMRDVDVVGNTISEGGGIYVRSYQNLSSGYFNAIYGVLIKGNQISNTTRNWMSYINVVMVNGDGIAFGTGTIGVEVRSNTLTANRPNVYSTQEEYAGTEGMAGRMPLESGGNYQPTTIPHLLGTIFDGNTCNYCDVAVHIGTGSFGTVINATKLLGTPTLYTDVSTVGTGETSTATVVK